MPAAPAYGTGDGFASAKYAAPGSSTVAVTPVIGPATISGVLHNAAGTGLASLTVSVVAADGIAEDGSTVTTPTVGMATTNASGAWSLTVPNPLPANLQALADANGGVLNVSATAVGKAADGTPMVDCQFAAAGVANGAATTAASADARTYSKPLQMVVHPETASTTPATPTTAQECQSVASRALAVSDSSSSAPDEAPTPTWQTADGTSAASYNPDLVGSKNYSSAVPADSPCTISSQVIATTVHMVTVGESHSYWNAYATFQYNSTMSSSIGAAFSADGKYWSPSGTVSQSSSTGHSTGYSHRGPYFSYQWRVPVKFYEERIKYHCVHGGDSTGYAIKPAGYYVPNGWTTGAYGQSESWKDGSAKFASAPYWGSVEPGGYYTLEQGRTISYGIAVSAFGVGLSATTSLNTSHMERIDAGTDKSAPHLVFSYRGPLWGNAEVVSSY